MISIILGNFEIRPDETIAPRLTFERHMQVVRAMWEFQTYERYAHLRCPVLALPARPPRTYSPGDEVYLASKENGASHLSQLKKDIRIHWMEDTIHDIPLQRPAELAALIVEFAASL
jgi:pimeloyl-ACP methyl ester carboxylesterase